MPGRKAIAAHVAASTLVALIAAQPAQANDSLTLLINGRARPWAAEAFIDSGHTMVPIRPLLVDLGAELKWHSEARTLTARLGGKQLVLPIDGNRARVDDTDVPLPVPVQIIDHRAFVPLRTVSESLGAAVAWDGEARAVHVHLQHAVARGYSREWQHSAAGDRISAWAVYLVGTPYRWGGTSPAGFDCSGLIQYVAESAGVEVPRTAAEQYWTGFEVSGSELEPGDLVFFTTYEPGPSHVGVFVGDGQFVHAVNPDSGVVTTSLDAPYWQERYLGARRIAE